MTSGSSTGAIQYVQKTATGLEITITWSFSQVFGLLFAKRRGDGRRSGSAAWRGARRRGCPAMGEQRGARPEVAIDLSAQDFLDHRLDRYAELRARCPVAWDTISDGFWLVTGYDGVLAVARESDTYMHKY